MNRDPNVETVGENKRNTLLDSSNITVLTMQKLNAERTVLQQDFLDLNKFLAKQGNEIKKNLRRTQKLNFTGIETNV